MQSGWRARSRNQNQPSLLCLKLLPGGPASASLAASDTYPEVVAENRARRRADKRWRTAFENAAIGIVMADFNGRYFAANSAFRNMLGYTERELYRLSFDEVTYEGDREPNVLLVSELRKETTTFRNREALSSQGRHLALDASIRCSRPRNARCSAILVRCCRRYYRAQAC